MTKTSILGENLDQKEKPAKRNGIEDEVKIFPLKKILSSKTKYQSPEMGSKSTRIVVCITTLRRARRGANPICTLPQHFRLSMSRGSCDLNDTKLKSTVRG